MVCNIRPLNLGIIGTNEGILGNPSQTEGGILHILHLVCIGYEIGKVKCFVILLGRGWGTRNKMNSAISWQHHGIEKFSTLLALCAANPLVIILFTTQRASNARLFLVVVSLGILLTKNSCDITFMWCVWKLYIRDCFIMVSSCHHWWVND